VLQVFIFNTFASTLVFLTVSFTCFCFVHCYTCTVCRVTGIEIGTIVIVIGKLEVHVIVMGKLALAAFKIVLLSN